VSEFFVIFYPFGSRNNAEKEMILIKGFSLEPHKINSSLNFEKATTKSFKKRGIYISSKKSSPFAQVQISAHEFL